MATVAMTGLVLTWALRRRWIAWIGFLFSRVTKDAVLDHERRRLIHEFIAQNPGASIQEVAVSLQLGWSIVNYHVRVLRWSALVLVTRRGPHRALFVAGSVPAALQASAILQRDRNVSALLQLLTADPRRAQTELAHLTGISQSHVSSLLRRMARLGLIQVSKGAPRRYQPTCR